MGLYLMLMGAFSWEVLGERLWMIGSVAAGLGFVIFVHEMGHFLVAKWCGVKCEKFYVGFDVPIKIFGWQLPSKLVHFQWGETEYGVGIIPLGGYVKMLGQDDDPRAAKEEMERIKIRKKQDGTEENGEGESAASTEAGSESERDKAIKEGTAAEGMTEGQTVETSDREDDYELDPRSFPAKTVPQRIAIISAGVIMNLIFAVLLATFAFRSGVSFTPCKVGGVVPGSPAWNHGIEPGSRIVQIGEDGRRGGFMRFRWDLSNGVNMVDDGEKLLIVTVDSQDEKDDLQGKEHSYRLIPDVTNVGGFKRRMIGVSPAHTTKLSEESPVIPGTSAAKATPELKGGDVIKAVNDTQVNDGFELDAFFVRNVDRPVTLTVERNTKKDKTPKQLDVVVQPNPIKRVGLVMEAGPVVGIRPGSAAEEAGFQIDDVIETIAGQPIGDPMLLPARIRDFHGQQIDVQVRRDGEPVTLQVTPRQADAYDWTFSYNSPMASQAWGLAFAIGQEVEAVLPESPAAEAGIKRGDVVTAFNVSFDNPENSNQQRANEEEPVEIDNVNVSWPFVFDRIQGMPEDRTLHLTVQRGPQSQVFQLKPVPSDALNPNRGFVFMAVSEEYVAQSWTEALALGAERTWEDANRVVLFLNKLVTGRLAISNIGGPALILAVAGSEASEGLSRLLIFLTFLSANLAVLNFLPIPALDGGHFMFLCWEGISGKPVNERVQIALTLAGVACLLGLMIFVLAMDINKLFF